MNYVPMHPSNGQLHFDHTQTVYNGINLDQELPGFRTLNVEGREVLSYGVDAGRAPGNRHGVTVRDKRLHARIITLEYEMQADDKYTFQERYRLLNDVLSNHGMDDVEVYFTDDEGFIYYGQATGFDSVPAHSNHIFSSFEIYCADPFRYDRHETILSEADGTLKKDSKGQYEIYYGGTAPNHFILRNRFEGENGYFQVVNEDDFFALGDVEELDETKVTTNHSIVYEQMNDLARWEMNTMPPIFDISTPNQIKNNGVIQGGFEATKWGVKPTMAFKQEHENLYHGPSATFTFEPDVLNETVADSFLADFIIHAKGGEDKNEGFIAVVGVLDQNDEVMMATFVLDTVGGRHEIKIRRVHFANERKMPHRSKQIKVKELNHGTIRFRKKGNQIDLEVFDRNGLNEKTSYYAPGFNVRGQYAHKVFIQAFRIGDRPIYTDLEFRLTHVQKYYNLNGMNDVLNLFAPDDVLEWDTKSGRRYINGHSLVDGLHLRSDVSMELMPGVNYFDVSRSPWYNGNDNLEFRYRNRYY